MVPTEDPPEGCERSEQPRTKSWKDQAKRMPSPPPELPMDTTELTVRFEIPVPKSDHKRVLISGGTSSLIVDDVTSPDKDPRAVALYQFIKEQFPALNKISVEFHLQRTAIHASVENAIYDISKQFVKLSHLSPFPIFLIEVDCMWLIDDSGERSIPMEDTKAAEWRNITRIFNDCAINEGLPKPFIVGD